jgi:sterol desaturase/sphingolipid hydroxylase (fatty acid hydroxylase superfamily)
MTIPTEPQRSELLQPRDFKSLLSIEVKRYKSKGTLSLLFVALAVIGFFYISPIVCRMSWPLVLDLERHLGLRLGQFQNLFIHVFQLLCYILGNMFYAIFYLSELPFIEKYKIIKEPWLWNRDPKAWRELRNSSIVIIGMNKFVVAPLFLFTIGIATDWENEMKMSIDTIPGPFEMAVTIVFCMLVEDFSFYWFHKFSHTNWIYPHIHKVHHRYNETISVASDYEHPLGYLMNSVIPSSLGVAILGRKMHMAAVCVWYVVRTWEALDGHSGYEFPWSPYRLIPFSNSAQYHDFHHSHNVGNYTSVFCFWDTIFGDNIAYYEYLQTKDKTE